MNLENDDSILRIPSDRLWYLYKPLSKVRPKFYSKVQWASFHNLVIQNVILIALQQGRSCREYRDISC
jgi:hypothetical protein